MKKSVLLAFALFAANDAFALADPAAVACKNWGGDLLTLTSTKGEMALCTFGTAPFAGVEEWTLFRYKSGEKSQAIEAFFNPKPYEVTAGSDGFIGNPASQNCEAQGGVSTVVADAQGGEYGVCVFSDNSIIEEWTLISGVDSPDNADLVKLLKK